jgi:regulatory protein
MAVCFFCMPFKKSTRVYDEDSLYEYAVQALGRRMRTVAELKRLLRQKRVVVGKDGEPDKVIDAVVARLKEQRYLNDTQYATLYSSSRKEGDKFGQRRVETDLMGKGVHKDVIAKTVGETYAGVDEEELARDYLRRKRMAEPSAPKRGDQASYKKSQKETAKVFRTLVRAGFRTATVVKILKNWNVEDEVLTALQEEDPSPAE